MIALHHRHGRAHGTKPARNRRHAHGAFCSAGGSMERREIRQRVGL